MKYNAHLLETNEKVSKNITTPLKEFSYRASAQWVMFSDICNRFFPKS